ncbi:hypothetical protein [Prevotella pallens]|uniref:hypothetical protein n=1 Tax=Prevotella pallens TaxID=60133 RepID=UPI0023F27736|nr:hypothetical protein [Prevotella pallens]
MVVFIQFGVNGHDKSDPYAYGMCAAIVYVQSMFIPRTRNIYPRTPTFTPRAPTVGSRFIVPAYYGIHAAGISLFH